MPVDERATPHSRDAERSLLGSMLRDNIVINDVQQIIRQENFYFDAHQKIFQGISQLNDKANPVDLVTLAEWLREQQYIEDIGGYAYLGELWESAPTGANAEYYARIVRDKAIVRNLITAGNEILRDAYDQIQPADEMLGDAERKILEVAELGITGQTTTLQDAIREAYDRIDHRTQKDYSEAGLPTGYIDLDEITAGLHNSELVILAARPSVGKTALSLNIVRNVVVGDPVRGIPPVGVFFVSLEQARVELAERLLCAQARVDSHKLRKGHLSADDMDKLLKAGDVLSRSKLFIDDTPAQGMLRIAANARRLKKRHDIKLVVIDYLQLIDPDNRRDSRQEQVALVSRRLKFLARELRVPVLALAQVNRSSEDRQDHRPRLADLRESGCLAGDTLVTLADSGERVPIRDLVGRNGSSIWALDDVTWRLKPAEVSNAFATGRKPVYRLETRLGRVIRATANHRFRAFDDWRRLDELQPGDRIALPRHIPSGDRQTVQSALGMQFAGAALYKTNIGRSRLARVAAAVGGDTAIDALAASDIYWDRVVSVVPDGEEDVYDLTVPGPANFIANSICVHNSIEQDADTVLLLHRPGKYEGGQDDNIIEVLIAKQRNGPTGDITLAYLKQYMRYENYAVGGPSGIDI